MRVSSAVRLALTLSYLKPRQILHQILHRVLPARRVAPPGDALRRTNVGMKPPLSRSCGGEPWALTFLNMRKEFDPVRFDWTSMEQDKLWRYNLHYFDYLHEPGRTNGPELIKSWIVANPQGRTDAWEPFPVSLRLVNWIKFFLSPGAPSPLPPSWLESLGLQARWLSKNIEYHLLANHYFKNGKALVLAGVFFDGVEARRWLNLGLRIVSEELGEQVLADGGHFERSPMYHCMILEDCLDLWNLCRASGLPELAALGRELERVIPAMLRFAGGLTHPDGGIALFNDAALGIEPGFAQLREYHERLGGEPWALPKARVLSFPDSGYFRLEPTPGDVLIVDCGLIGPDYQPGHAHCDTLSFELSLNGRRVVVDSGCSQYVDGDIRQYNRGSAGHNSLTIDGVNQSEVWGAHRVARRARPLLAEAKDDGDALTFEGAHDGYTRLAGQPIHTRQVVWAGGRIEIRDLVEGHGEHQLELRLHVHPDWTVESANTGFVILRQGQESLCVASTQGDLELERGWYCPRFGTPIPCPVLSVRQRAVLPWTGGFIITKES